MGKIKKTEPTATSCCVNGCPYNVIMPASQRFYRFPSNKQKIAWIEALSKINGVDANGKPWTPDYNSVICCNHFIGKHKSISQLKKNYVPTIFSSTFNEEPEEPEEIESVGTSENFIIVVNDPALQENQTIAPSPTTSSNDGDPNGKLVESVDVQAMQFEFIDHVVMVYLNRCRSRAGDSNVGMPNYILKRKAQEAAILLGAQYENQFHWIANFKKKLAENDAKGIVLTSIPESLSIADIISEEWPKFAMQKGLNIDEDSEETNSALGEEEYSTIQAENMEIEIEADQIQSIEPAPDCSMSVSPVIEETFEVAQTSQKQNNVTKKSQENDSSQHEFLKQILRVFIGRVNAKWPQAEIPDIILHSKFREAAMILGSKIKNRNVWLSEFKHSLKTTSSSETILYDPNQSFDINDIIEEERPKFFLENDISSPQGQELIEEVITNETITVDISEQKNVESPDTIHTYKEARDCLHLLNSYAMVTGDFSALALIKQVDSYLRSDDCED